MIGIGVLVRYLHVPESNCRLQDRLLRQNATSLCKKSSTSSHDRAYRYVIRPPLAGVRFKTPLVLTLCTVKTSPALSRLSLTVPDQQFPSC